MVNQAIISAISCNLVSFTTGTAITWASPVLPKLKNSDAETVPFHRQATEEEASWIGSLLTLGAILGPFINGRLADKIGRKLTLILLGVCFVICYLTLALAKNIMLYYAARFISGVAVGGVYTVVPIYLAEIAEDTSRGAVGSIMNILLTGGLLFSYAVGPYTNIMTFNLILEIAPSIFVISFIFLGIESPYYHIVRSNYKAAAQCLDKLRRPNKNDNELNIIKYTVEESQKGSVFDLFRSRGLMKAIITSMALVGFQQLSGILAVLFYAQTIFQSSGSSINAEISSIIIGIVFFSTSFVTPLFVDKWGRKILLYFSAVGMVLSEFFLGLYFYLKDHYYDVSNLGWLPVVSMVGYIVAYNSGFGPLAWTIMGELFPPNVKSIASSLTTSFCWSLCFITTKFFQSAVEEFGTGALFWTFASFCVVSFFFTYFFVIETKGKSLEEIQQALAL